MEIKAAYDVLKRADKREWYDRQVNSMNKGHNKEANFNFFLIFSS